MMWSVGNWKSGCWRLLNMFYHCTWSNIVNCILIYLIERSNVETYWKLFPFIKWYEFLYNYIHFKAQWQCEILHFMHQNSAKMFLNHFFFSQCTIVIERNLFCKLSLFDTFNMIVQFMSRIPMYPEGIHQDTHLHSVGLNWWGKSNIKFSMFTHTLELFT